MFDSIPLMKWAHTKEMSLAARQLKSIGWSYNRIANVFSVSRQWVQILLRIPKTDLAQHCQRCGKNNNLCGHHINYLTDEFETVCASCHALAHRKTGTPIVLNRDSENPLQDAAINVINRTLKELRWNKRQTALKLGISRPTLDAWIAKYKLKPKTR